MEVPAARGASARLPKRLIYVVLRAPQRNVQSKKRRASPPVRPMRDPLGTTPALPEADPAPATPAPAPKGGSGGILGDSAPHVLEKIRLPSCIATATTTPRRAPRQHNPKLDLPVPETGCGFITDAGAHVRSQPPLVAEPSCQQTLPKQEPGQVLEASAGATSSEGASDRQAGCAADPAAAPDGSHSRRAAVPRDPETEPDPEFEGPDNVPAFPRLCQTRPCEPRPPERHPSPGCLTTPWRRLVHAATFPTPWGRSRRSTNSGCGAQQRTTQARVSRAAQRGPQLQGRVPFPHEVGAKLTSRGVKCFPILAPGSRPHRAVKPGLPKRAGPHIRPPGSASVSWGPLGNPVYRTGRGARCVRATATGRMSAPLRLHGASQYKLRRRYRRSRRGPSHDADTTTPSTRGGVTDSCSTSSAESGRSESSSSTPSRDVWAADDGGDASCRSDSMDASSSGRASCSPDGATRLRLAPREHRGSKRDPSVCRPFIGMANPLSQGRHPIPRSRLCQSACRRQTSAPLGNNARHSAGTWGRRGRHLQLAGKPRAMEQGHVLATHASMRQGARRRGPLRGAPSSGGTDERLPRGPSRRPEGQPDVQTPPSVVAQVPSQARRSGYGRGAVAHRLSFEPELSASVGEARQQEERAEAEEQEPEGGGPSLGRLESEGMYTAPRAGPSGRMRYTPAAEGGMRGGEPEQAMRPVLPGGEQAEGGSEGRTEERKRVAIGKSKGGGEREGGSSRAGELTPSAAERTHEPTCAAANASLPASQCLLGDNLHAAMPVARNSAGVESTTTPDHSLPQAHASPEESCERAGALVQHGCSRTTARCSGTTATEGGTAGNSGAGFDAPGCQDLQTSRERGASGACGLDTANRTVGCAHGHEKVAGRGKISEGSTRETSASMDGNAGQAAQQAEICGAAAIRLRYPELFAA